jgi:hypothetical protein
LQGRTACMTSGQWNQHPHETTVASRLKLLAYEVKRLLPVGRQHVVGEPRYIHDRTSVAVIQQTRAVLLGSKKSRGRMPRSRPLDAMSLEDLPVSTAC